MMDPKPQPNHRLYLEAIRRMSPGERLRKAWDLSEFTKQLALAGLRERFPNLSDVEVKRKYLEVLARCHNENY
jgi:hypothetical protein